MNSVFLEIYGHSNCESIPQEYMHYNKNTEIMFGTEIDLLEFECVWVQVQGCSVAAGEKGLESQKYEHQKTCFQKKTKRNQAHGKPKVDTTFCEHEATHIWH